ncbi:hypothetical protein QFZ75_007453 [Streptomyces sp. V3I8]|uniref:hypothetical protein n=1 Tax=Streptomyces sp. V3I8 TaxID=3042279 RepID=UPI00278A0417|nr:hypothetical protein [Streptomyces sp. V3I8]MDQ1041037.1 hypothetical protein [Streptomyces sp. V3I8]
MARPPRPAPSSSRVPTTGRPVNRTPGHLTGRTTGRKNAPVTGMVLAALFTLLGVLGLQGAPFAAPSGSPAPAATAAHHGSGTAATGIRNGVDDTCATACGQPPRAGRVTPGEWHVPPPGAVPVPAGLVLPLPEPGPPMAAAPGAFAPLQHCARHSGRGPPPPTGI